MKLIFNPDYIKYKMLFMISINQAINKNLVKLFIKVNNQIYFPEFIFYRAYDDHFNEVCIELEIINDIACEVLQLTQSKCNERTF